MARKDIVDLHEYAFAATFDMERYAVAQFAFFGYGNAG